MCPFWYSNVSLQCAAYVPWQMIKEWQTCPTSETLNCRLKDMISCSIIPVTHSWYLSLSILQCPNKTRFRTFYKDTTTVFAEAYWIKVLCPYIGDDYNRQPFIQCFSKNVRLNRIDLYSTIVLIDFICNRFYSSWEYYLWYNQLK